VDADDFLTYLASAVTTGSIHEPPKSKGCQHATDE